MKRKQVRDARGALTAIKTSAIGDIVIGVMFLVGLAFLVGMVRGAEAVIGIVEDIRPWGQLFVIALTLIWVGLLLGGIYRLYCHNKISEVFKEAFPDEDDD